MQTSELFAQVLQLRNAAQELEVLAIQQEELDRKISSASQRLMGTRVVAAAVAPPDHPVLPFFAKPPVLHMDPPTPPAELVEKRPRFFSPNARGSAGGNFADFCAAALEAMGDGEISTKDLTLLMEGVPGVPETKLGFSAMLTKMGKAGIIENPAYGKWRKTVKPTLDELHGPKAS